MDIYLYNTLTKRKELFVPINNKEVTIYSCGPTVYKDATIGNMRTYIFNDILHKIIEYNGFSVKHAMNITDVGHLVSDADEGEDKMVKSSIEMKKEPKEIAEYYTKLFFNDLKKLNIKMPDIVCNATDNINEMIEYVQQIIKNGYAYETSTAVYFDVSKLDKYGILSGIKLDEQQAGARVKIDTEKKNPYDFALFIKAPENHIMKWETPWGKCYPGWHIECSAMSQKYLGEEFDIHTGGIDLIPTHHENEIAQCKGACGKIPSRYWLHGEYLLINGGKMSKSLGNVYLLKDIEQKGYDPLTFRLFLYSSSYRNKINFTWESIDANSKALEKIRAGYRLHLEGNEKIENDIINDFENKFHKSINDDLNMPQAMSVVWDVIKYEKKSKDLAKLLKKFDFVLSLNIEKTEIINIPKEIMDIAEKRKIARQNKDWEESDRLRNIINAKGYEIKDNKDGYEIKPI